MFLIWLFLFYCFSVTQVKLLLVFHRFSCIFFLSIQYTRRFLCCACVFSGKRLEAHCRRLLKQTDVYSLLKYKLEAQVKIAKPNEQFGR